MIDLSSFVSYSILGVISLFIYKTYIWPYYISPLRKIPGPPSRNLLYGNLKTLFTEESGEAHLRWANTYGNFIKYHGLLNRPALLITDTKMIQEVVNQEYDFPKPHVFVASAKIFLGDGLILAEGETHKRQRKMMNPAFTHNNIKSMTPTFVRIALTLNDVIKHKVNEGESKIILTPYISKAALDVIGSVGFNHEFNSLTSPSELAEAYNAMMNAQPNSLRVIINMSAPYFPSIRRIPITINKKMNHARKVMERESKKLVEEKYNDDKNNKLDGNDLLSLLININKTLPIGEKMTDEELRHQIMTFLLAGHEAVSTTVCWALHFLSQHPHEQDLLREELVKAFPDKSKFNPTLEEINSLEYLNCVIKETMRLTPPVAIIQRNSAKNNVLGGHFIPKGTPIDIPVSALHRLPSVWGPTANDFDPKRWLNPSLVKNVTNFNYLPFHTGIRSCIGQKIGLNEIKMLLSVLVRNFVFQPVEGLHIKRRGGMFNKPEPYVELIISKVES